LSERYYQDIREVQEVASPDNATVLLKQGWELLKIAERMSFSVEGGELVQTSEIVYILGKRASSRPRESEIDPSVLERLPWTPYRSGSRSGWIWADPTHAKNKGHEDEVAWLKGKLEREGKFSLGEFEYSFSGPSENPKMFVSRREKR